MFVQKLVEGTLLHGKYAYEENSVAPLPNVNFREYLYTFVTLDKVAYIELRENLAQSGHLAMTAAEYGENSSMPLEVGSWAYQLDFSSHLLGLCAWFPQCVSFYLLLMLRCQPLSGSLAPKEKLSIFSESSYC